MQGNFPKIPILLSIIFFLFSLFILFSLFGETNNNAQKSQLKESEWQTETLRREEIKALDHSVRIIEEERRQLETHFAQSSDIVPFLDIIEGLASKVGAEVEITSVDILTDRTGLAVGMKVSGAFNSLYRFLTLLEDSPYELELTGMDMHRETEINIDGKSVKISKWSGVFKVKLLSFIQ